MHIAHQSLYFPSEHFYRLNLGVMPKFYLILAIALAVCLIFAPESTVKARTVPKGQWKFPFNHPIPVAPVGDRIVNGTAASKNEFPFIASIRDGDGHFCGGSLWAPQWVLTAAHCIEDGWSGVQVVLGAYDLDHPDALQEQTATVNAAFIHPKYNPANGNGQNDLALLRVNPPFIPTGVFVRPISTRNTATDPDPPPKGVVAGWGALNDGENQQYPSILQKTTLDHFDDAECVQIYAEAEIQIDPAIQICYLTPYTDSCQGDSGGPLVGYTADNTALPYQEGVVTGGINCADLKFPGVYVRLIAFANWILQTIRDNSVSVVGGAGGVGDIPIEIPIGGPGK